MWPLARVARRHRIRRTGGAFRLGWLNPGAKRAWIHLPSAGKALVALAGGLFSLLSLGAVAFGAFAWAPVQSDGSILLPTLESASQPTRFLDRADQHLLLELRPAGSEVAHWVTLAQGASSPVLIAAAEARLSTEGERRLPSGPGASAALQALVRTWAGQPNLAGEVAGLLEERRGVSSPAGLPRFRAALLAANLAWRYPAQALLEYALNTTYYGRSATGLGEAAVAYFGKSLAELRLDQVATLTVLGQDPTLASHLDELPGARARLLSGMVSLGWMGGAQASAEATRAISVVPAAEIASPALDAFARLAQAQLETQFGEASLVTSGFQVTTSLDFLLQLEAECAAQTEAARLAGAPEGFRAARADGGTCDSADLIQGLGGVEAPGTDFGVAVVNTATGELLAYFPSLDDESQTDRVGQPGTALLPFLYLAAFSRGYSTATPVLDVPLSPLLEAEGEAPLLNPDGQYLGILSARQALLSQRLVAAAGLVEKVGLENVLRTLSELGIYSRPEDVPRDARSLLLEGGQSSLLALTRAYAILANQGTQAPTLQGQLANLIERVALPGDRAGEPLAVGPSLSVVSPGLAYLVQDVLSASGEGAGAGANGWSEASFAGSSTPAGDSWAVFLTPDFVVGVWAQGPDGSDLDREAALPLARAIGRWLEQGETPVSWAMPSEVTRMDVCDPSGLLPSADCPKVVSEVFLSGLEPSQVDNYYQKLPVDVETGRLATLWTSPSLVQDKVFQNPPEEARPWTPAQDIPLIPQEFDTLPSSFPYPADLHITSPGPFSVVHGVVPVLGTASLEGQAFYVLQAGESFYPSLWYQVTKATSFPREAKLGDWDTRALEGLVALQLLGVGSDGHVESFAIPVTIDNVAPTVQWVVPPGGDVEQVAGTEVVVIQVQAQDNLGLSRVDFYLDGQLAESFAEGPYSVRWSNLPRGTHEVEVHAVDRAGNEADLGPEALIVP